MYKNSAKNAYKKNAYKNTNTITTADKDILKDEKPEQPLLNNVQIPINAMDDNAFAYLLIDHLFSLTKESSGFCGTIVEITTVLFDCFMALQLFPSPTLKYAGPELWRQTLFLSGTMCTNFFLTAWAAMEAYKYLISSPNIKKINKFIGNELSLVEKLLCVFGILFAIGTSLSGAAIPMLEEDGTMGHRVMVSAEVFLGSLPLDLFSIFLFIEAYKNYTKAFSKRTGRPSPLAKNTSIAGKDIQKLRNELIELLEIKYEKLLAKGKVKGKIPNRQTMTSTEEILAALFEKNSFSSFSEQDASSTSCENLASAVKTILGIFSACFFQASWIGTIATTQVFFDSFIPNKICTWSLNILSNLLSIYLNFKFGYNFATNIFDTLVSIFRKTYKKNLAQTLYPWTTNILAIAIVLPSIFSYPLTAQLTIDNFSPEIRKYIFWPSNISAILFYAYSSVNCAYFVIEKIAKSCGSSIAKQLVEFKEFKDLLCSCLKKMDGEKFAIFSDTIYKLHNNPYITPSVVNYSAIASSSFWDSQNREPINPTPQTIQDKPQTKHFCPACSML